MFMVIFCSYVELSEGNVGLFILNRAIVIAEEFITVNDRMVSLNCQPPSSDCSEADLLILDLLCTHDFMCKSPKTNKRNL